MYDLYEELNQKNKHLNRSVKELRTSGTNYAQAEQNYKMELSKETLKLRDSGMPVTMIPLVVYGRPNVAKLRFERDVAEAVYKANLESINSLKLQIRILENQIGREWSNTPNE